MRTVRRKRDTWYVEQDGKVINYFYEEDLAYGFAGIPKPGAEPKLAGAIVEETILEADLDNDGVIEKAELEAWLQESEEK